MILQPALKSLTSKGEHSALPNMTFTVLIGITHWNLVALHKTIDYLFPTPYGRVVQGGQDLIRGDGIVPDTHTDGVVDSIGNRRAGSDQRGVTQPFDVDAVTLVEGLGV